MFSCRIHDRDLLPIAKQVAAVEGYSAQHDPDFLQKAERVQRNLNRDFIRATISVKEYIELSRRLSLVREQ